MATRNQGNRHYIYVYDDSKGDYVYLFSRGNYSDAGTWPEDAVDIVARSKADAERIISKQRSGRARKNPAPLASYIPAKAVHIQYNAQGKATKLHILTKKGTADKLGLKGRRKKVKRGRR